jgi:hypothetical protein
MQISSLGISQLCSCKCTIAATDYNGDDDDDDDAVANYLNIIHSVHRIELL